MTGEILAWVDSAIDFTAIPAEAAGPESLATLDTPLAAFPAKTPEDVADDAPVLDAPPVQGEEDTIGGEARLQTADDTETDDTAISIAAGNDLILEGGDKVEW